MRLQKRQYVLIVLILALGAFNLARWAYYRHLAASVPAPAPILRGTAPAWSLFDTAANLRDAANEQFQPALKAFNDSVDKTNAGSIPAQVSKDELADLHGCQTWLQFYRQDFLHPGNKPGWHDQMLDHVQSCAANHRDIAQ